jgi:hypothetical protein
MKAKEFASRLGEALGATGRSKLSVTRELQARREQRAARGEPTLRKVDRSALYSFLDGRDIPPADTAAEIADLLGVRLGWLVEGEEPMESDLAGFPAPIWLVDGQTGPWRRPGPQKRIEARGAFLVHFFRRCDGYEEAEAPVRTIFKELLARRLTRRRDRGDRGPSNPEYRAKTARSLFLKCFLDVLADLPQGTRVSSPTFTAAFLSRVAGWLEDEER